MDDPWLMQNFWHTNTLCTLHYFKTMNSSKNVNQNTLKIPYFFEKICENSPSSGGSAFRSQLASGGWGLFPQALFPRWILPTPTVLLQNVLCLSPFSGTQPGFC